MYENIKTYWKEHPLLSCLGAIFSALPSVLFFATLSLTATRLYYTEKYLPYLLGVWFLLPLIFWVVNFVFVRKKALGIAAFFIGIAFSCGEFVFLAYSLSKLTYFFMAGTPFFLVVAMIGFLVLFLKSGSFRPIVKRLVCALLAVVFALISVFGLFHLLPVYFNSDAVVFAVEDEYQIGWSTSTTTVGYVVIGDNVYTDSVAGEMRVSKIHKVSVDRAVLEQEKEYTICAKGIFNKRAYLTVESAKISRSYPFRPIDATDGVQIYDVSDNHLLTAGAVKAGSYWGDDLDLLIANGDLINDVSAEWQITNAYRLMSAISQSSRPVIVTRGNHEAVGTRLTELPNWFGSRDGTFYYTVRFDDILFIVLDIANDMDDTASTISATANYNEYREKEVEWLTALKESEIAKNPQIRHVIGVCHIAFPLNLERYHGETSARILSLTESMGVELLLSGHSHRIAFYDAKDGENVASYPVVLGSVRNDNDLSNESVSAFRFTGTALEIGENITLFFTDSKHEIKNKYTIQAKQ